MADPRVNQIRIKTGVLKRLVKEKIAYEKELEREKQRLEKMKEEERDVYETNKQQEVINETIMLLPDCQRRINAAYEDLQKLVKESEFDLVENEIFTSAKGLLQEVQISA
ncbi:PREDICTED: tubulin-specific chaperone A-like [Rhagoletis zephyria]|uniref:tubulin-specific chaperone A-like n=1 Tax=Rhagoletis zephyria TaxID=28612 RepID=UPI0008114525|nr:PREDICTED: tubulin-specific chaperone A-like [Rhagoletis zephyria]KAH9390090.1 hypothetical protein TYRP_007639 [Tyrophagus putrescentiae]